MPAKNLHGNVCVLYKFGVKKIQSNAFVFSFDSFTVLVPLELNQSCINKYPFNTILPHLDSFSQAL